MADLPFSAPSPIRPDHVTSAFDCGKPPLNEFLQRYALANDRGGSAKTFVVAGADLTVIGYYSLAAASIEHASAPDRLRQGQPRHPIPAILMARFAVDITQQGKGLGRALFYDAITRTLTITRDLGVRAFVVDAKDDDAARFYAKFGMESAPNEPRRLYLLLKDIRRLLTT